MKLLFLAIIVILTAIALYFITDYPGRMKEYNAHVCAVNGYQEDCKTPLDN